jgi:regulatory protein
VAPRGNRTPRETALRALTRREHSAAELKRKLERRGHDQVAAAGAVDELSRRGLQSDARFAEMLVRSRVAQGFGPARIEAELEAAGVAPLEIAAAIAAAEADWRALCVDARARRFKGAADGPADWQKQYRFLAGRGFEPEQIYAALKSEP